MFCYTIAAINKVRALLGKLLKKGYEDLLISNNSKQLIIEATP